MKQFTPIAVLALAGIVAGCAQSPQTGGTEATAVAPVIIIPNRDGKTVEVTFPAALAAGAKPAQAHETVLLGCTMTSREATNAAIKAAAQKYGCHEIIATDQQTAFSPVFIKQQAGGQALITAPLVNKSFTVKSQCIQPLAQARAQLSQHLIGDPACAILIIPQTTKGQ